MIEGDASRKSGGLRIIGGLQSAISKSDYDDRRMDRYDPIGRNLAFKNNERNLQKALRNTKKDMEIKKMNVALWIILLVYLSVVFYFTIIGRESFDEYKLELQPLKTIIGLLNFDYDSHGQYILRQILSNIGLLMPVGFLLGFPSTLLRTGAMLQRVVLWGFLISLTIETIQLITKTGTFEVDDLIYNTLGCAMGYLICPSRLLGSILR